MADVVGFNPRDAGALIGLLGGGSKLGNRREFIGDDCSIFIARTPVGGIPATSGTWPTITVTPTECELAWIDGTTLGPKLDANSDPIVADVCNIADSAVGGEKLIVVAREFLGYTNVCIWELC